MARKLKWQGEEVETEFKWLKVYENKEKPLYWYNYEVYMESNVNDYAILEAIKITYGDYTFYISNHCGIGIRKLRKGGWPDCAHFGFDDVIETNYNTYFTKSFCLADYEQHEKNRRAWQLRNFPIEFEKNPRLKKLLIKY